MRILSGVIALAVAVLSTGCASLTPSVPPGASQAEVQAALGRPGYVVSGPDGAVVWQYLRGQTTYIVTFGPDARAKGFRQALSLEHFAGIRPGMTQDEIRLEFGRPATTTPYRNLREEVWSYRYQAGASDNRIFNVHFDAATGRVRSTSDQEDPFFSGPVRAVS